MQEKDYQRSNIRGVSWSPGNFLSKLYPNCTCKSAGVFIPKNQFVNNSKKKMQGAISSSSRQVEGGGDYVSVEIIQGENLLWSIKEKMENVSISHCICRVPEQLSNGKEDKYFPKCVSIGPFHRGKIQLKDMENQKWQYLNALLNRRPDIEATLDGCIKRLRHLEQKARKCYEERVNMGRDEFLEMMLLDGCFIIELLLKFKFKGLRRRDDVCFSTREAFFYVRRDLILLENQIPFFVLEHLYTLVPLPKECSFSLIHLFLFFAKKLIDQGEGLMTQDHKLDPYIHHLLDLIRHCYLPTSPQLQSIGEQKNLHSATQLQAAGIKFRRKASSNDQSLLNVTYDKGVFEIPPLKVQYHSEVLFRNIIAFEECAYDHTKHVASYVYLMKCLIRSELDVSFLRRMGILGSTMENEEEILHLFNSLRVKINVEDFYYRRLCEKVNGYNNMAKKKIWCHKMGNLYHTTPWGLAAFVLAVLALVSSLSAFLFFAITFLFHHA